MRILLAISVLFACTFAAAQTTIVSDVGDRDGYNGMYNPDTVTFPFRFNFNNVPNGSDAPFTDKQNFSEQSDPTYNHVFSLPSGFTITSIVYEIVTFDNASQVDFDQASNGKILLDGVELQRNGQDFFHDAVGELANGADGSFVDGNAEIFTATVNSSFFSLFADGNVLVTYDGSTGDGSAVDYSRFIITGTSVPEPSTYVLGILALSLLIVRRKK